MRAGFDMNPVFQKDIGGAQDVFALIGGIGDMMQPPVAPAMLFGAGQIIGLVVDGEPAAPKPPVIKLDLLGNPRAQTGLHEVAKDGHIFGQQVQVINPARTDALRVKAARHVFQRGAIRRVGHIAVGFPIKFKHMAERVLKPKGGAVAQIALGPAMNLIA